MPSRGEFYGPRVWEGSNRVGRLASRTGLRPEDGRSTIQVVCEELQAGDSRPGSRRAARRLEATSRRRFPLDGDGRIPVKLRCRFGFRAVRQMAVRIDGNYRGIRRTNDPIRRRCTATWVIAEISSGRQICTGGRRGRRPGYFESPKDARALATRPRRARFSARRAHRAGRSLVGRSPASRGSGPGRLEIARWWTRAEKKTRAAPPSLTSGFAIVSRTEAKVDVERVSGEFEGRTRASEPRARRDAARRPGPEPGDG